MAVSVTEHFKLDKKIFESTGAFDALLDQDTHLFVDPFLLKEAADPIFKNGRDALLDHFREIIKLLSNSKKEGDVFWRNALNKFKFREIAGFGLGYAKIGTSGSGIGEKFTASLIQTADAIVNGLLPCLISFHCCPKRISIKLLKFEQMNSVFMRSIGIIKIFR